ncbi:NADP-dependent oxidoreductase [Kitasatospora sp. NPDC096147]|uniref:NADP-dependent oxidoreductase n=1 Tax=Kitasatospora sp. NPDC096147 TaxID=3364093 RepID=UPI003829B544
MTVPTMHAIRITEFGGPERLTRTELPRPVPGPGEVLVRVRAAGYNPADMHVREGFRKVPEALRPVWPLPVVLGSDLSGTVAEVGPGVTEWQVGDEVYGLVNFPGRGAAYAEYATAPAAHLARKPATLDHVTAAGVPMAGLTAHQFLFHHLAEHVRGTVLVNGAAGGVGHFAVQLARAAGAERVVAVASGRHREYLEGLGVDLFVDREAGPASAAVRDADFVLDTVGGPDAHLLLDTLRPGGALSSVYLADQRPERAAGLGVTLAPFLQVRSSGADLAELGARIDAGEVVPAVDAVFPLREAAAAHEHAARGHLRGKIVLTVD